MVGLRFAPVLGLILVLGVSAPVRAQTGLNQPRMHEALDALNAARDALQRAYPNKGGHDRRAIAAIERAIREVEAAERYAF